MEKYEYIRYNLEGNTQEGGIKQDLFFSVFPPRNKTTKKARIKIAARNINNLRNADDTTLMAESEEELERILKKINK